MERKIASKAKMLGLIEVLVKQYSAPQAEPEKMLMGSFPSKFDIDSCRFLVMHPRAHEPRIGVELGARAQRMVTESNVND